MNTENKLRTNFYNFTTKRPVAILMAVIGVVVFGWISYKQLPLNLMPDMTYPSLTVRTEYPGTAPQEIETTISRPIEQALGVVDNLVTISSISKAEQSDVILEYTWDTDMNSATADIREKLDQVFLPTDVKRPIILRYDPSLDPILRVGLFGKAGLTRLRYIAEEEIKRALETVDGVAAVKVKGGLEEEIRVEMNEQKLTLIGMDIQTVKNRLQEENVNLAGGNLKEGETEYLVRTLNEFKTVKEIEEVVIGRWNNVDIKVKDVAKVRRTNKEREVITRIDGHESVEIEIYKEADANIVSVAKRVKEKLYGTPEQQAFIARLNREKDHPRPQQAQQNKRQQERRGLMIKRMTNFLTNNLPEGIHIETLSDQSVFIKNSVDEVTKTAVQGGILAILVLFLFLRRLGPTVIIGISIPISIIATFAPMKIFDVSLNIMSLGGLALGIGMLVDNSIVVLESISRYRDEGIDLITAALRGVSEVGGAVIASTLTTIAVFLPIVFVEGVAGQVFGDMALTVVFSLLASLAAALFLIPMLSSRSTETFVNNVDSDKIPKDFILNTTLRKQITDLFENSPHLSFWAKIPMFFRLFVLIFFTWIRNSLKVLVAITVSFIKQVILAVLTLAGVLLLWWSDQYREMLLKIARNQLIKIKFVDSIWSGYLVYNSAQKIYASFSAMAEQYRAYSVIKKIVYSPLNLLRMVFYVFEYILTAFSELIFRFSHGFILLIGLFGYLLLLLFQLAFSQPIRFIVWLFDITYTMVEKGYEPFLRKAIKNSYAVVGGIVVLFLFTIFVIWPRLGSELIPEVHQGEFYVELKLPVGTPVEKTDKRILPIQEKIEQIPGVARVASVCGTDKSATSDSEEGEHTARLTITLKAAANIAKQEERISRKVRKIMEAYSGIEVNISRPVLFSSKTPVEIYLKGYSLRDLQTYSRKLEEKMRGIDGLLDIKSNIQRGNPEVQIFYNRKLLARHNLNIRTVASIIRNKVRGDVATEFREADRRIDVLVRLREADKESLDDLRHLVVNPGGTIPITLQSVAEIRVNEGPSEIRRISQQRTGVISANLAPGFDLAGVNSKIYDEIQKMKLPMDISYEIAGQNKEMETSLNSLMMALALAVFLVYIVMASQFESLVHPFIIIFTIPLAVIGVVIFLYLFNIPLSIVVFLGMIMLAGIVVNNAIVLVDYINYLRKSGVAKLDAVLQAGKVRLRPILMTTSTTVLGLFPMALGLGDGAEIRTPMAITVIVGLLVSTLLTLVVIPTVYNIFTRENPSENELASITE